MLRKGATGPTAVSILERTGLSNISTAFEQQITNGTIPGAVMILAQNGEIVLFRSLGLADAERGIDATVPEPAPSAQPSRSLQPAC